MPDRQLLKEAMDWMLRLSASPTDRRLRQAAEAWRSSDPAHKDAWRQAERAWRAVAFAQPSGSAKSSDRPPATLVGPSPRRQRWPWITGAASIIAVMLLSLYIASFGPDLRADHATWTAEHRRVGLQDGTVVELGASTGLNVRFDERRRSVDLLAGEAFFSVVPDDARPFVVLAGGVSVLVTGTAFNVRVDADAVVVAVEHGSVEVAMASATPTVFRIQAGDQLVARHWTASVEQSIVSVTDVGAWRRYKLFVDNATVGDVVNELRRYDSAWVVVTDGDLLKRRVTGLYDLRDTAHALRVLVGPFGGEVRSVSPLLTVVSGP